MYQQNAGTGFKWLFWFAIVVMIVVFSLGINIKDATWLNGNISVAQAARMDQETDINQKNAELDYQLRKTKIEAQIEYQKQLGAYQTAQLNQKQQAQIAQDIQYSQFVATFQNTIIFGTTIVLSSLGVALLIAAVFGIFALSRRLNIKTIDSQSAATEFLNPWASPGFRIHARLNARRNELRKIRKKIAINNTRPFWPDGDQSEDLLPSNYPRVN